MPFNKHLKSKLYGKAHITQARQAEIINTPHIISHAGGTHRIERSLIIQHNQISSDKRDLYMLHPVYPTIHRDCISYSQFRQTNIGRIVYIEITDSLQA